MKRLLLSLALLAAAPVAVSAAECQITLDVALEGTPASARITLSEGDLARMREIADATGRGIPSEVVEMIAVPGELTQEVLLIGLNKERCVNGAALISARTWVLVHGLES